MCKQGETPLNKKGNDTMTNNKKLTKRDHYNTLLNLEAVKSNKDLREFVEHELELLAKKNSADRGMTKTQKENLDLQQKVLATLKPNMLYTVSDICIPARLCFQVQLFLGIS